MLTSEERRRRMVRRTVMAVVLAGAVLLSGSPLHALPMKTEKGNPVANWILFGGKMYKETGQDPPKITHSANAPALTPAEKAKIIGDDRAAHPSIPAAGNADPSFTYDCHGLTFKAGALWIDDDQVQKILDDQGWTPAPAKGHKVGDIVVYKKDGAITHTGVVTKVDGNGNASEVRSKWGARGEYTHAPNDVPAGYGAPEVRTGGKPLKDPPLTEEDVNVFHGHQAPVLKQELVDPFLNPEAPTRFNDFPIPELNVIQPGPANWLYGLDVPKYGMHISPGDQLTLYGTDLVGASVSGSASLSGYGGWELQSLMSDTAIFIATADTLISGGFSGLIDGFGITSSSPFAGTMVYTESVAGSVGLSLGPVPEPMTLLLLGLGACFGLHRRRSLN